ncbi:MAG: enhanced serine sensitivity protein SseB [Nevskiaceae bacterium]|nr:MAG: enhanced serine sensitivity protein SseB [Nevskiaceae bacterium]
MEEPQNPLEMALAKAATDPAERPTFYRLLMESEVFVLGRVEGDSGAGRRTIGAGEKIALVNWEKKDGTRVIPFFASLDALRRALKDEQPYLGLSSRSLFEMTKGSPLVLNPASSHAKEFLPKEVEALLSTGMNQVAQTRVVQKATQVLLGQPANYPSEIVSSLTSLLAKHSAVEAAYLCLMHDPSTQDKPSLVVGFEGGEGIERAMQEAGSVATDTAPKGVPVDFVRVRPGDEGVSAYLKKSTKPFYERTWGSKLKSFFGHGRA